MAYEDGLERVLSYIEENMDSRDLLDIAYEINVETGEFDELRAKSIADWLYDVEDTVDFVERILGIGAESVEDLVRHSYGGYLEVVDESELEREAWDSRSEIAEWLVVNGSKLSHAIDSDLLEILNSIS